MRLASSRPVWAALAAAFAVAVGAIVLVTGSFGSIERESRTLRFNVRHSPKPTGIAIIGIDGPSLASLDEAWPLRRSIHARAIDALRRAGARTIVYDVQFTEPTTPNEDGALMRAVQRAGNVVLATTEMDAHGHTNVLGGDANLRAMHARAGAATVDPEPGGMVTRFPYEVSGLKSLPVATAERFQGRGLDPHSFAGPGAWIDWRGGVGTFPKISFRDVVNGHFDRSLVAGRIVVVGATAPTLQDLHATPTSGSDLMPGPEIQANAIATALDGIPLRSAPRPIDVLLVLLLGIAIPLAGLRLSTLWAAALVPILAAGFAVAAQAAFDGGWILTVVPPLVALLAGAVAMVLVSYLTESRERERVVRQKDLLEHLVRARTEEVRETQLEIIWRLSQMAESRDEDTGLHIERISALSQALALEVGLPPGDAEMIGHAAALHDVGKIGVPDRVLLKPGKLDPDEFEIMKTHTTIGANVLSGSSSPLLQTAEEIARSHHERWDGGGYPDALAAADIPLAARICSVCDVFDALMSKRAYKDAWSLDEALAELVDGAGTQFDPALAEAFVRIAPEAYEELKRQQALRRLDKRGAVPQLIGLHVAARPDLALR